LDWHPDKFHATRSWHKRVVSVKNVFDSATFDKDVSLLLEYQQDLHEECSKCVSRLQLQKKKDKDNIQLLINNLYVFQRRPDGVTQVTFREPEGADACDAL
jgi:HIV Tat-specific factor 1